MPRLKSSNFAVTQLSTGIDSSATSFTVDDASAFPDSGPFMILVHDNSPGLSGVKEIMEVGTIDKTTKTFSNVLRGREGTSAVAHSEGNGVEGVWTAGTHQELADASELSTHASTTASISTLGHVKHAVLTATLDTTWSGSAAPYSQTITVNGITSTDTPIVDVVMSGTYTTDQSRLEQWGYVYRITTGENSITVYATDKPTVELPIQIKVVR